MPLTTDELHDLCNAIDLAIGSYSLQDSKKLAAGYRPHPGIARLCFTVPELFCFSILGWRKWPGVNVKIYSKKLPRGHFLSPLQCLMKYSTRVVR